ncbi:MAG: helix-turn-helix transcriptional regulator [Pseudomonadota bacterium]
MTTQSQLNCISSFYDVLLDETQWVRVLDEFATVMNAKSSAILLIDQNYPEVGIQAAGSIAKPEDLAYYAEHLAEIDLRNSLNALKLSDGGWVADTELYEGDFSQEPVTAWLARTFNITNRALAPLNRNGIWIDAVSVQFDGAHGPIRQEERALSSILHPHFAKVLEINRPFQILRRRFAAVLAALDRFQVGVLILSAHGSIAVSNAAADRALDQKDGLSRGKDHTLRVPRGLQPQFDQAVSAAISTGRAEGTDGTATLAISRPSNSTDFILEISPLGSGDGLDQGAKWAVVFVIDPDDKAAVSVQNMRVAFGLTEAETDVLSLLVNGHSSAEIADIRSTSPLTARSQAKSVYTKTEVSNRADLVRLALKANPPIDRA